MKQKFPTYEELVKLVNEILANAVDKETGKKETLTLRQIFYKLVVIHAIDNTTSNYKLLSAKLVLARERGDVDDRRIEDRARETVGGDCSLRDPEEYYQDHETAFRRSWEHYSRPFWLDQQNYVEIWLEKNSLVRIVSSVASQYNVITCVGRGYSSYSYINDAVQRIRKMCFMSEGGGSGPPSMIRFPKILYLGDFDPNFMCYENKYTKHEKN